MYIERAFTVKHLKRNVKRHVTGDIVHNLRALAVELLKLYPLYISSMHVVFSACALVHVLLRQLP